MQEFNIWSDHMNIQYKILQFLDSCMIQLQCHGFILEDLVISSEATVRSCNFYTDFPLQSCDFYTGSYKILWFLHRSLWERKCPRIRASTPFPLKDIIGNPFFLHQQLCVGAILRSWRHLPTIHWNVGYVQGWTASQGSACVSHVLPSLPNEEKRVRIYIKR